MSGQGFDPDPPAGPRWAEAACALACALAAGLWAAIAAGWRY